MRLLLYSMLLMAGLPVAAMAQTAAPAPPDAKSAEDHQADSRQPTPTVRQRIRAAEGQPDEERAEGFGGGTSGFRFGAGPMEKGPWIGISTSTPSPALRHQLKLPVGTGLVVEFVQPKSPADQAGVKQYDLLVRLDDQLLINSEQFAVLVRTYKPGDEVKLKLLREGTEQTIPVKLIEREVPRISYDLQPWYSPAPDVTVPGIPSPPTVDGSHITSKSLTFMDGKRQLKIESTDGHRHLVATDKGGKVLFDGPIDTEEQRKALPSELREPLERVLKLFPSALDVPKPQAPSERGAPNPLGQQEKREPTPEQY